MSKKLTYKQTIYASYLGYITQAAVNGLPPLLFVTFSRYYGVSLLQLSLTVTVNFLFQLLFDIVTPFWVKWRGVRNVVVKAHISATLGLILLGVLPSILPRFLVFPGILFAVFFCSVGGGVTEVLTSPIVESCPGDDKAKAMGLLHSMFSIGSVLIALTAAVYFYILKLVSSNIWQFLPVLWALVPLYNTFLFAKVPIDEEKVKGEDKESKEGGKVFTFSYVLILICMLGAGSAEMGVSQWVSAFMEVGLGMPKSLGDIIGPCGFATLMAISRILYAKFADKVRLSYLLSGYALGVVLCYAAIAFGGNIGALIGCALTGFFVGPLWPGVFSLQERIRPGGGTKAYSPMALAGDIGCSLGSVLIGFIADHSGGDMIPGYRVAMIVPAIMIVASLMLAKKEKAGIL